MKVLLLQDVEKLGRSGDIKEVAGGFGRNYLIPKGYAVLATRGQIRQAEERLHAQQRREAVARRDAEALASRINGQTLRFVARAAGELDRLYGSVTNLDIANRLHEQFAIEIDRRKIDLEDPIKRMGVYPVKVKLAAGLEPVLNVVVEAEGGSTPVSDEAAPASEEQAAEADAGNTPEVAAAAPASAPSATATTDDTDTPLPELEP
jgi:large subunit ribosomal protein L9